MEDSNDEPTAGRDGRPAPVGWDHLVQFYDSDGFLADSVAAFLGDGLLVGEPLVVLSTRAHRDDFIQRLQASGLSWDDARRSRRLTWIDAHDVLEAVMIGRVPDPQRFDEHVGSLIRANLNGGEHRRVRAYGELVDLLWREGDADAALILEDMWNDLARTQSFSLLCAYSRGNIYRETRDQRYRQVCQRHAHVLPAEKEDPRVEAS